MEWHISPVARKSSHSDKAFEKDDRVLSSLVRTAEGELVRIDLLESEADELEISGDVICTWTQAFKPKPTDGKEEAEALKLTADNLFISLFEGEEEGALSEDNAELKHLLALMLERRKVLRLKSRTSKYVRYVHRPSKKEYLVSVVDLEPSFFIENEEKLSFLLEGVDSSEAPAKRDQGSKQEDE